MNLFLRSHKIVDVEKHFSDVAAAWTFCITFIDSPSPSPSISGKKEKVDYKEILDEPTFARFSRLREARKLIANDEAVPAYSIFTNEELAGIASLDDLTKNKIASIQGIGDKRAEKYAERMLELYQELGKG